MHVTNEAKLSSILCSSDTKHESLLKGRIRPQEKKNLKIIPVLETRHLMCYVLSA